MLACEELKRCWNNTMDEKIIIREVGPGELEEILRLNFDLFKKEYRDFDKSLDMKWTYGKVGKSYFKSRISRKDGLVLVAEIDGKIIGYLCGGLHEHGYREKAIYAELENMIVDKNIRGKGIGTKLVQEFFIWCKKKKVKYIDVTASAKNENGIAFYRKLGFKDYNLTLKKII